MYEHLTVGLFDCERKAIAKPWSSNHKSAMSLTTNPSI